MAKNNKIKGWRSRRLCISLLREEGWRVDVVEKTGKFIKVKDMFSLFDIVAIKDEVMFVQVTTNKPHTHTDFAKFKKNYPFIMIRQYVHIDRKGFKIYEYKEDGTWKSIK